ncbi:hypothetical protein GCM10008018_58840 [Paenibacillus marchantiophytorum]|uniref:Uncharacterized protein n=1 Tax=Paenibacillus marchantiophytorum TaxID=1619310 RepID=A0ABQ1FAZ7_9BACL|nr:hypothetical protein GCM10008018_58840 [Paenibacillus marchantiophytorum]
MESTSYQFRINLLKTLLKINIVKPTSSIASRSWFFNFYTSPLNHENTISFYLSYHILQNIPFYV